MYKCEFCGAKMFKSVSKSLRLFGASVIILLIAIMLTPFLSIISTLLYLNAFGLFVMTILHMVKPSKRKEIEYRCPRCKSTKHIHIDK